MAREEPIQRKWAFVWVALATSLFLMIPFVAMQMTDEVAWTVSDFVIMGALILTSASLFMLISRRISRRRRFVAALAVGAAFLYVWAELAVGIFFSFGS